MQTNTSTNAVITLCRNTYRVLALAMVCGLSVLLVTGVAKADQMVCTAGSSAGQCKDPYGVAVDEGLRRVYVLDSGNNRVDVFEIEPSNSTRFLFAFGWRVNAAAPEEELQTCTTATGCLVGSTGSGSGQFGLFSSGPVAVDPISHAVYVADQAGNRIQKFDQFGNFIAKFGSNGSEPGQFRQIAGIDIDSSGDVYVADSIQEFPESGGCDLFGAADYRKRVQRFTSAGAYVGTVDPVMTLCGFATGFALSGDGGFYLTHASEAGGLRRFAADGTEFGDPYPLDHPSSNIKSLAADSSGNVFLPDATGQLLALLRYDGSGAQTGQFFFETLDSPNHLAVDSAAASLYASDAGNDYVSQVVLPPPGPLLIPGSVKPCPASNVKATLCASFNPEGKPSKARFEYISKADYEAAGNDFGPGTETTPFSPETPADFTTKTVNATNTCIVPTEGSCLSPDTTYVFRAVAVSSEGEVKSEPAEFTTLPPHEILAMWSRAVDTDTARLFAEANPRGIAASGHFEVIAEGADYQANGFQNAFSFPAAPQAIEFGAGEAPVVRSFQLTGLQPDTAYHYRLVLEDPYFAPVISSERNFVTFQAPGAAEAGCANQAYRTGPSAALPDCRAYEMVSPVDKSNGDVFTRMNLSGYPTNLDQSSLTGSAFAFTSYKAFGEDPQSSPYTNQYLARRTERGQPGEGWATENLSPPRDGQFSLELENEFQAFDPDLERSWMLQEGEPQLDPCAPAGVAGLYRRDTDGAFAPLSCSTEGQIPVDWMPEFQGASADGSRALFRAPAKLTEEASSAIVNEYGTEGPVIQLYESTPEGLRLVSALPSGEASATANNSAGTANQAYTTANHNREGSILGALSADGTRVFWTAGTESGKIYLRLNSDQQPSKINKSGACTQPTRACTIPVSETVTSEPAFFQMGNRLGTMALFTVTKGPLTGNLYRFDSEAQPPASTLIAEGVIENILGAAEDLSRVYFASRVANSAQQAEGAIPGEPNVYLWEEGTTRFVATLSTPKTAAPYSDYFKVGEPGGVENLYGGPTAKIPVRRTSRVAPDGGSLVFMSNNPALAMETAGYDNTDVVNGQDDFEVYLYDAGAKGGSGALRCISCNPGGARPAGAEIAQGFSGAPGPYAAATVPRFQTQLHQPRYLTDDGNRVFFNSFESLSLADTNGEADVYQWEAAGTGSCGTESPAYVPTSEGCLQLLSTGKSTAGSQFLDADPDGSDAFFTTVERLLPQDPGLIDVYDARVQGGFPAPPAPPAACEGEACQGPILPPSDPTPSSASFHGAGNVAEGKAKSNKCPKGKVKKRGRCVKKQPKQAHRNGRNHR